MKNKILSFVLENDWNKQGWGNGYVIIFKDHPMWGVGYGEIPVYAHGGLTFSNTYDIFFYLSLNINEGNFTNEELKEGWVIGFDTRHLMDTPEVWTKKAVLEETENLKNQMIGLSLNGKPLKKFNFNK